jgi:hypothetical protein
MKSRNSVLVYAGLSQEYRKESLWIVRGLFVLNRVLMMGIMAVISPLEAESMSAGGRI